MDKLKNKIIVVTGGSGLLGKAFIKHITDEGAIAVNFDINHDTDFDVDKVHCDVTSYESIVQSLDDTFTNYGRIDGLVNNAYPRTKDWGVPFEEMTNQSLKDNVDWQLNSYILLCKEILKYLRKESKGSIVNIASIYGVVGNDFQVYEGTGMEPPAAYSAIKGGLINFTRFLASKYGREGIRVNCVSPGGIFDNQNISFINAYEKKVPLKRMGNPTDISPAVSFLLSDEANYITGQNLIVDGGWTSI